MAFLSDIICRKGIKVHPNKTNAVKSFPRPLSPLDIEVSLVLLDIIEGSLNGFIQLSLH